MIRIILTILLVLPFSLKAQMSLDTLDCSETVWGNYKNDKYLITISNGNYKIFKQSSSWHRTNSIRVGKGTYTFSSQCKIRFSKKSKCFPSKVAIITEFSNDQFLIDESKLIYFNQSIIDQNETLSSEYGKEDRQIIIREVLRQKYVWRRTDE